MTSTLFGLWNRLVESAAVIAIILLALGTMLGINKLRNTLRRLGAILGVAILLELLPAILTGLWAAMSYLQKIGLCLFLVLMASAFLSSWPRNGAGGK